MWVQYDYTVNIPNDNGSDEILKDVLEDVREFFNDKLFKEEPLVALVDDFGLGFSERYDATINITNDEVQIRMYFHHERRLREVLVEAWLLEVSDGPNSISEHLQESFRSLTFEYTGDESVRTSRTVLFRDLKREFVEGDEHDICLAIEEALKNDVTLTEDYEILAVQCEAFNSFDAGLGTRGRQLQRDDNNSLNFEITVTGKYRVPARRGEIEADIDQDFSIKVEVSCCFSVGMSISIFIYKSVDFAWFICRIRSIETPPRRALMTDWLTFNSLILIQPWTF